MADKEIGSLTSAGTLDGAEKVHVVKGGNSRQTTTQAIAGLTDLSAYLTAAAAAAGYQPLDADLTAIAALATTSYGRALLALADIAALAALGLKKQGTETIWVPSRAMVPNTTNGPSSGTVEVATNLTMLVTLDFDASTAEAAQFVVRMPKSYNLGTVTAQAVWKHAATTTNFGVVWDIAAGAYSDGDDPAAFGTAVTMSDTGGTTNRIYHSPVSGAVTIANTPAAGDLAVFRVRRAPSDGNDTMAIDAGLLGIVLLFTSNAADDT